MEAGVPGGRVLGAVLYGGVPDHDALVVVLDDGLRQLRDGLPARGSLGPEQDRVFRDAHLDGET